MGLGDAKRGPSNSLTKRALSQQLGNRSGLGQLQILWAFLVGFSPCKSKEKLKLDPGLVKNQRLGMLGLLLAGVKSTLVKKVPINLRQAREPSMVTQMVNKIAVEQMVADQDADLNVSLPLNNGCIAQQRQTWLMGSKEESHLESQVVSSSATVF